MLTHVPLFAEADPAKAAGGAFKAALSTYIDSIKGETDNWFAVKKSKLADLEQQAANLARTCVAVAEAQVLLTVSCSNLAACMSFVQVRGSAWSD